MRFKESFSQQMDHHHTDMPAFINMHYALALRASYEKIASPFPIKEPAVGCLDGLPAKLTYEIPLSPDNKKCVETQTLLSSLTQSCTCPQLPFLTNASLPLVLCSISSPTDLRQSISCTGLQSKTFLGQQATAPHTMQIHKKMHPVSQNHDCRTVSIRGSSSRPPAAMFHDDLPKNAPATSAPWQEAPGAGDDAQKQASRQSGRGPRGNEVLSKFLNLCTVFYDYPSFARHTVVNLPPPPKIASGSMYTLHQLSEVCQVVGNPNPHPHSISAPCFSPPLTPIMCSTRRVASYKAECDGCGTPSTVTLSPV